MFSLSGLGTSGMMKTRVPRSLLTSTGGPGAVQAGIALSAATFEATLASRPDELPDEFAVGLLLAHTAVTTSSAATAAARHSDAFTNALRRTVRFAEVTCSTTQSETRPFSSFAAAARRHVGGGRLGRASL